MIDTIVFDIGNVLIDFSWAKAFNNMNLSKEKWERLRKATVGGPIWDEFDRGILNEKEIMDGFIAIDPEIEAEIRDFMDNHYHEIITERTYAADWIDELKKNGYKVYFLSNFSEMGFRVFAKQLEIIDRGDGSVISYRVKQIKPNEDIYHTLIDKFNLIPENTVFIDDTARNIETANRLKINGILFESIEQVLDELGKLGVKCDLKIDKD